MFFVIADKIDKKNDSPDQQISPLKKFHESLLYLMKCTTDLKNHPQP